GFRPSRPWASYQRARRAQPSYHRAAMTQLRSAALSAILEALAARTATCLLGLVVLLSGCKDQAKESAATAAQNVTLLGALIDKDVAEVERGMPEGAKRLAPLVAGGADPRQDVAGARKALLRVRRDVMDLSIAKSTFFALADTGGIAIRNDLEE